jgi:hypothetical protein
MMVRVPAPIRSNNPGASWDDAFTRKWGSTKAEALNDGLGQGNRIAYFPTKVQGAACQFDRWLNSGHYRNKPLAVAIKTWSGGNSWQQYVDFLCARVPGLTADTTINAAFLSSARGIQLMKAQAWHESGEPYPMTDAEWAQAQAMVFHGTQPTPAKTTTKTVAGSSVVVSTTAVATTAAAGHASPWTILAILAVGIVIGVVIHVLIQKFHEEK